MSLSEYALNTGRAEMNGNMSVLSGSAVQKWSSVSNLWCHSSSCLLEVPRESPIHILRLPHIPLVREVRRSSPWACTHSVSRRGSGDPASLESTRFAGDSISRCLGYRQLEYALGFPWGGEGIQALT